MKSSTSSFARRVTQFYLFVDYKCLENVKKKNFNLILMLIIVSSKFVKVIGKESFIKALDGREISRFL